MVRFEIKDPVSLAAGRSAMVPVLTKKLPVKLYSMFIASKSSQADLIAQIENTAETAMVPGPVTVSASMDNTNIPVVTSRYTSADSAGPGQ